jgi:large subunit ribosomal protein L22
MTRQAEATLRMLRISPIKLNLIAKPLRHKSAYDALRVLKGMRRRAAADVYKVVASAVANAENNHGLDMDRLFVAEVSVGRNIVLRRTDFKGRSRMGRITKPFSQIHVVLREHQDA